MRTTFAALLIASGGLAAPAAAEPVDGQAASGSARTTVPLVTTEPPGTASVMLEAGWSTVTDQAMVHLRGEVRVWRRLSVLVGAQRLSDGTGARPGFGVAYQITGERAPVGVRVQVAYRPEGFVEPEGEIEASTALARDVGPGRAVAVLTYGQDPEGNERDAEAQAAYVVDVGRGLGVGGTARGRRSLGRRIEGDRTWDAVAGPYLTAQVGLATVELMAAVERAGQTDGTRTGALLLAGAGASW